MIKITKYILIEYWTSTDELMIKITNDIFLTWCWTSTNELMIKFTKYIFNRILKKY